MTIFMIMLINIINYLIMIISIINCYIQHLLILLQPTIVFNGNGVVVKPRIGMVDYIFGVGWCDNNECEICNCMCDLFLLFSQTFILLHKNVLCFVFLAFIFAVFIVLVYACVCWIIFAWQVKLHQKQLD